MSTQDRMIWWQTWRETRAHWMIFALALHIPAGLGLLTLLVTALAPGDGLEVSASQAPMLLNLAVAGQTVYILFVGLYLIGYITGHTVRRGLERGILTYLVEQPVPREHILRLKLFMLGTPAVVCSALSLLTTVTLVYLGCTLLIPGVTPSAYWDTYRHVVHQSLAGCLDLGVVSALAVANAVLWMLMLKGRRLIMGVGLVMGYVLVVLVDYQALFQVQDIARGWHAFKPFSVGMSVVVTMACMRAAHWAFRRREWAR